jgi:hypothetical protein
VYTLRFLFLLLSTFGYFFGSEMDIVLFSRAFYLVECSISTNCLPFKSFPKVEYL